MKHIPNLILHHYTSGDGVLGIVESDSIWSTRIQYMNDSKEFSHAIELANQRLRKMEQTSNDDLIKQFCKIVQGHLQSSSALTLYVACFSEIEDSLSQWRGYCPPSFGYSLGFNGDRLKSIGAEQGFDLRKCIYDRTEQEGLVQEWAENSINLLADNYAGEDDIAEFCCLKIGILLQNFITFAPFLKHPSFKEENEWRLVSTVPTNNPRTKLRPGKSMLIPYVPIKLNLANDKELLWNARIGPTPHIELAMNSATLLFNKVHFKNGIGPTSIPYRDW